ncbi:hypothetical protein ELI11_31035 (plasmid) [Rhizobium ruizarguesonis]|nr:hypothetical protein ELI11_31035 [Rhizobium ruizarguesonis]
MALENGLSRVRSDPHARFLGGGGAAMPRCYPTRRVHNGTSERDRPRRRQAPCPFAERSRPCSLIIGRSRETFPPPMRQPREGRDPNGRRPFCGLRERRRIGPSAAGGSPGSSADKPSSA